MQTRKHGTNITEMLRCQYDANRRLTNRWSLAKGNTAYAYDEVGNLTAILYPDSTIQYTYDAVNRLTNMVDAAGTSSYVYHGAGVRQDKPWESGGESICVLLSFRSCQAHLRVSQSPRPSVFPRGPG